MAQCYGMDSEAVLKLTLKQYHHYLRMIPYVLPDSTEFGKPPAPTLPDTPLTRYAKRCDVDVPFNVHQELIKKGV